MEAQIDWTLDELLESWRITYDDMLDALLPHHEALEELNHTIAEISEPFKDALKELEPTISELVAANAKTHKGDGVEARYRKGAHRVTYDWRRVDTVRDVLRDVLPDTAATLDAARRETTGKPGVSIFRTQGEDKG